MDMIKSKKYMFDKLNEYINNAESIGLNKETLSKIKTVAGISLLADLFKEKQQKEEKNGNVRKVVLTVVTVIAAVAVFAAIAYAVYKFLRPDYLKEDDGYEYVGDVTDEHIPDERIPNEKDKKDEDSDFVDESGK